MTELIACNASPEDAYKQITTLLLRDTKHTTITVRFGSFLNAIYSSIVSTWSTDKSSSLSFVPIDKSASSSPKSSLKTLLGK